MKLKLENAKAVKAPAIPLLCQKQLFLKRIIIQKSQHPHSADTYIEGWEGHSWWREEVENAKRYFVFPVEDVEGWKDLESTLFSTLQ